MLSQTSIDFNRNGGSSRERLMDEAILSNPQKSNDVISDGYNLAL